MITIFAFFSSYDAGGLIGIDDQFVCGANQGIVLFLATTFCRSLTLERLFELSRHPSRALNLTLCVASGTAQNQGGHCQECWATCSSSQSRTTDANLARLLKTHFFVDPNMMGSGPPLIPLSNPPGRGAGKYWWGSHLFQIGKKNPQQTNLEDSVTTQFVNELLTYSENSWLWVHVITFIGLQKAWFEKKGSKIWHTRGWPPVYARTF